MKIFRLIISAIIVVLTAQIIHADDEAPTAEHTRLSAKCRAYYNMAQKHRTDTLGVIYSDSMRMTALEEGNDFALLVALNEANYYYCNTYNIPMMERAAKALRKEALRRNDLSYFFHSYQNVITTHLRRGAFLNALQTADEMRQMAANMNSDYGFWASYKTQSDIYSAINNQPMRRQSLINAIEYWPRVQKTSVAPIYARLAETEDTPEEKLIDLQNGMKHSQTYYDTAQVNTGFLRYYAEIHDVENFNRLYSQIQLHPKYPSGYSVVQRTQFEAFKSLFDGDKAKAEKILYDNRDVLKDNYITFMEQIHLYSDDYRSAYEWHKKQDSVNIVKQYNISVNDIYAYNSRLASDSLRYAMKEKENALLLIAAEQEKTKAENARLELEKRKAEAERLKTEAENQRKQAELEKVKAISERNSIKLQEAEQRRKRAEAEQKVTLIEAENQRLYIYTVMGIIAFILLVLFIIFLILYIRRKHLDMIAIKKLNHNLQIARDEAEHANQMKDVFLQNMTHEIRTPLNAITGFSQILACPGVEISDEEKVMYGNFINDNTNLLTALVNDILNASDIQTGNFKLTLRDDLVSKICESTISVTKSRIPENLEFRYVNEIPEDFHCLIELRRCQQVLVNYITNACKYTEQGHIELRAYLSDDKQNIIFTVSDTGKGVAPEYGEKIFERFTKLDDFMQGTGLGLNICRSIAEKLDGKVWLDTSYTEGARFCFQIPVKNA